MTWPRIFKLPFQVIRETKIETLQYKILHRIISCNKWLFNIKIKTSDVCDYCKDIDVIPHFFFHCMNVREFWKLILNSLETISNLQLKCSPILEECIIFSFPEGNISIREEISVINFCIIYIKYYIYFQRLFNNNLLDVNASKFVIKSVLETEKDICTRNGKTAHFGKHNFIYGNL